MQLLTARRTHSKTSAVKRAEQNIKNPDPENLEYILDNEID